MPADAESHDSDATASESRSARASEWSADAVIIPFRETRADSGEQQPEIRSHDDIWWYHQKRRGANNRSYSGHVEYIGGAEGERIRRDLTTAIANLLAWATERDFREDKDAA